MLYYTTVLLKNLYQYISKEEQIRLASSIQRIVNISKRSGQIENNVNYWGFNIVKLIQSIPPIPRKAIYQHPLLIAKAIAASKEDRTNSGDPFIYNPFAKKKNDKVKREKSNNLYNLTQFVSLFSLYSLKSI